jgi:hypothetical protein
LPKRRRKNQILEKTLLSLKDSNVELINSYKELCDSYKKIKEAYESLLIGNAFSKPKVDIGITCNLIDDDMPCVASSCSTSKASVSTSCDDLLDVPCSSSIDENSCSSSSMYIVANLVEENKQLQAQVKDLKEDLDRSYKGKNTLDEILSKQKSTNDKCGLGFHRKENAKKTRHMPRYARKHAYLRNDGKKNVSKNHPHITCFGCHEKGHFASVCANMKDEKCNFKLRQTGKKQDKTTSHRGQNLTCYNCRKKGHIGKNCPIGNTPKPNIIFDDYVLRKNRQGNVFARYVGLPRLAPRRRTIWVPRILVTNIDGPNFVGDQNVPK